jgi:hypothetical protein
MAFKKRTPTRKERADCENGWHENCGCVIYIELPAREPVQVYGDKWGTNCVCDSDNCVRYPSYLCQRCHTWHMFTCELSAFADKYVYQLAKADLCIVCLKLSNLKDDTQIVYTDSESDSEPEIDWNANEISSTIEEGQ